MGRVEAAFGRQDHQRGMTVEEIMNECGAASMHTAHEHRPAGDIEATGDLFRTDRKRAEP